MRWRRVLIVSGALLLTAFVCWLFARGFFVGPADWVVALGGAFLLILCLFGHFSWLLWMIGFAGWRSRPREEFAPDEPINSRTALVMPIYHEDVDRVSAGIRQTWLSVERAGLAAHCDFYVISDSVLPEVQRAENEMIQRLLPLFSESLHDFGIAPRCLEPGRDAFHPRPGWAFRDGMESVPTKGEDGRVLESQDRDGRLFLVRRTDRVNFKAGNIANFLQKHGAAYDFMLVLDADSVMLGPCIRRLILKMERRPRTGIIQSLMSTFRGTTPFAQAMQFSISRLGAIFSCGFGWFLGTEALYWGHNAIIRIPPFMAHAQLPIFPGKPPLGGRVLSQDVHEASLLGRAGWEVELDLEPGGSFEEIPSNVISYGKRDQRWCTGDFLNSALILAPGFKTGQRVWLAYAMSSYSISLVLLAMMLIGFELAARQGASTIDATALWWALIYMPVIQLGSKFLLFWLHLDRSLPLWRQGLSLLADIVAGLLLTPLLVYQHVTFVLGILLGKAVQWASPSRDPNDGLSWRLAARVFWVPTLAAAVWIPLAWILAPAFLFFSGTILVPWLLSIPLAVISTDPKLGDWLARHGVFACRRAEGELEELGSLVAGTGDAWWGAPTPVAPSPHPAFTPASKEAG